jgi:hydrophobe/amphiphile efflux-1 (HAE1) family protein
MIEFFIKRPIFAGVISILMVFIGLLCLFFLPLSQFPDIVPPQIQITTQFLGASSEVVSDAVTTPIELSVNGVNGMSYINSSSSNLGYTVINANFDFGTNVNVAASDVFTNISNTTAKLPAPVNQSGITVSKVSKNMVLVVNLIDKKNLYDSKFLGNYADINIVPVLKRIKGVGDVKNYGILQYAIRVWLDPDKMASLDLTPDDVIKAIKDQNQQAAMGIFARPPTNSGLPLQIQVVTEAQLKDPDRYADIIVKEGQDGNSVKIRDIGWVELGAQNYDSSTNFDEKPTATIGVYQYPNSNAVDIASQVIKHMEVLKQQFPEGVEYIIGYDTTEFVKESLKEVMITLFEAIVLVFAVVYVFLQKFRTTLIPCIAIPVSLIGAFTFFMLCGFSINTLSLLGLVLAIGLVVDDAIVVVENVERKMEEGITDVKQATLIATEEVKSPIIATTLILLAVFVPVAFIPGISGMLYNQFALAIAFSVLLSGINSLTLSPALCGILLKAEHHQKKNAFFEKFEYYFNRLKDKYSELLDLAFHHRSKVLMIFISLIGLMVICIMKVPKSFLPEEDQGYLVITIKKPDGYNVYSLDKIFEQAYSIISTNKGVAHQIMIGGTNIVEQINQPNQGVIFARLKPWSEREGEGGSAAEIIQDLQVKLMAIKDAQILVMNPPSIPGISTVGGFQFVVQDKSYAGVSALAAAVDKMIEKSHGLTEIGFMVSNLNLAAPSVYLDIDRNKASALKVSISDVYTALQSYYGSYFVNNFTKYGQVYRVLIQADSDKRLNQQQISQIYIRNQDHKMVPLSSFIEVKFKETAFNISHYNLYSSAIILGAVKDGISTGDAIRAINQLCAEVLPKGFVNEWIGITAAEIKAGNIAFVVFGLCLMFVFLFLAALYESWSMPLMILLVVPLAILGAVTGLLLRQLSLDVFGQIGLILLIGLAAKNAILIVEFAKNMQEKQGLDMYQAVKTAALLRLRPILMTSLAFILGVFPLVVATGAGAMSRQSIGTTVMFGMLLATFLTLFMIPVFYVYIEGWRERKNKN